MKKAAKILCFVLGTILAWSAHAYPQFCCSDSNWQQDMLSDFNTQNNVTDFSFPSGIFRKACTNCEYDLKTVRCYCQDVAGLVSNFPSYFTLNQCQNVYDNRGGFLKCGD